MEQKFRRYELNGGIVVEMMDRELPPVMAAELRKGDFEGEMRELIRKYIPQYSDLPVIEIGAGSGVTTVEIARCSDSQVLAVDANEGLIEVQSRIAELNDVNFKSLNVAYDPRNGTTTEFRIDQSYHGWTGASVMENFDLKNVQYRMEVAYGIGAIRSTQGIRSDYVLVMDAEGAEKLLVHDRNDLKDAQLIIMELHPDEENADVDSSWFDEELGDLFEEIEYVSGDRHDHVVYRRSD